MSDFPLIIKYVTTADTSLPEYKTYGAAGLDIPASQDTVIPAHGIAAAHTGLFVEIPQGYEIQVRSRSGLALNHGVFVLNAPGTVDSDYRGEIKVILANFTDLPFTVRKGDRIAQLVVCKVERAAFTPVSEISETSRGKGGFGSTGIG